MKKIVCFGLGAILSLLPLMFSGCYSVPVSGRSGLSLVSDEEVVKMSLEQFDMLKRQYSISRNPAYNNLVEKVGKRIAEAASGDIPNADWEFVVFDDPGAVNAFAMAGGKVGVFTGLFKVVKTEDELAIVLGHEIAHVAAKHVNERLSKQMLGQTLGTGLAIATSGSGVYAQSTVLNAYGLGSSLSGLGFNRKMESEADYIGLIYAARAGYNPEAAYDLWENMEKENDTAAPPEFFSTHPSHGSRILHLRQIMPQALAEYEMTKGGGYNDYNNEANVIVIE